MTTVTSLGSQKGQPNICTRLSWGRSEALFLGSSMLKTLVLTLCPRSSMLPQSGQGFSTPKVFLLRSAMRFARCWKSPFSRRKMAASRIEMSIPRPRIKPYIIVLRLKLPYNRFMSQLYVVATPIGNLGDITYRAVETLSRVKLIAAEDTRHSLGLLNHFQIRKTLISCHGHNEEEASKRIIDALGRGEEVAYISDAGTPGISDPGARLVRRVREAGFKVVPIPGASALTALASVSGVSGRSLVFEGFLSPKSGRRKKQLKEILERGDNCIVYESPFRIVKLLGELAGLDPKRRVVIGRELTKVHEEILEGRAADLFANLGARSTIKGEFSLLIASEPREEGESEPLNT